MQKKIQYIGCDLISSHTQSDWLNNWFSVQTTITQGYRFDFFLCHNVPFCQLQQLRMQASCFLNFFLIFKIFYYFFFSSSLPPRVHNIVIVNSCYHLGDDSYDLRNMLHGFSLKLSDCKHASHTIIFLKWYRQCVQNSWKQV